MNIAILGGSFNPPHICHTFVCCYILATTDVDQIWMVPCYQHAFGKMLEPFHHRFAMCRHAIEPLRESRVIVSAIEQERRGTSWTIDTVRYVRAQYPEHEFVWVIGSDVLADLGNWKNVEELNHLITFLVVPRSGFSQESAEERTAAECPGSASSGHSVRLPHLNVRRELVDTSDFQLPGISSSLIRQRVQAGQPITHLVSKPVADYIRAHRLYRSPHQ